MYRNLLQGLWFLVSMLVGAAVGVSCLTSPISTGHPETDAWIIIRNAVIGTIAGGIAWKWWTWRNPAAA